MLTPGNVSDIKTAPALLERAGRMRYLLGDKGCDADRLRHSLGLQSLSLAASIRSNAKLDPPLLSEWPLDRYLAERRDDRFLKLKTRLLEAEARRLANPSAMPFLL